MGFKVARRSSAAASDVETWFETRGHPQTALMRKVRAVILGADSRVSECVKWSCPTFTYNGNLVSINPQAKNYVSLMFHTGGKIPGRLPQLTGAGATCKYMRIENTGDLAAKRGEVAAVVRAWCDWKSAP